MRTFQELNPSNARIYINYEDKKHPVTFDYPNKHTAFGVVFPTVLMNLILFLSILFVINLILISFNATITFKADNPEQTEGIKEAILILFGYITPSLILVIIISLFITAIIISNKKLLLMFPKVQLYTNILFGMQYSTVLVKNLKKTFYELPIFDNVFLEYYPKGDYSKYLKRVEVTEHDFWNVSVNAFTKKKKKVKNDGYWKARFIFSRIPKKGEMIINFM